MWTRDDRYVMTARNDGAAARLYDLQSDPQQTQDIAGDHPDIVRRMFDEYVLEDAGGPLPTY